MARSLTSSACREMFPLSTYYIYELLAGYEDGPKHSNSETPEADTELKVIRNARS
jgi:hypothetical protein